jgi:WD40 repeat protein
MADHLTSDQTIKQTIYEIVKERPSVLDEMTIGQALGLFVKTVQAACDLDQNKPVVIVIDGLDETQRDKLEDTAKIFSNLFKELKRRNAKVFISSRTDDEITRPFYRSLRSNERHVRHVHLDTSNPSSIEDVSRYLFRRIEELVEQWELNWAEWPGEERLKLLCVRAGGLFIWAVTVVKFFQEQIRRSRHERLKELLDVINEEGMGDVNKLYGKILEITHRAETNTAAQNEWEGEKFRWIVGFIATLKEPLTIGDIGALLELRRTPKSDSVDVLHFITNLRTVLIAGSGAVTNDTIPRLHKSFVEYITSDRPEPQFRIDKAVVDGRIARNCLQLVGRLRNAEEKEKLGAGSVQYAIHNWTRHLSEEGNLESGVGIVGGDGEGLWKMLSVREALRKRVMSASGDYRTHMYNPKLGFPTPAHYRPISTSSPICAIAVSPDNRLIAAGDADGFVRLWDSGSYMLISNAGKHRGTVRSLCFSPDSQWLVSGSEDKSVRIWDSGTGQAIGDPLAGHTHYVYSVCTDGQRILSGSYDKTIRIWSCHTQQLVRIIRVEYFVGAVALSRDRIAAGVGSKVCVFNVETGHRIALMEGHNGFVWTVAFSSDGSLIASGSEDTTIRIWDSEAGKETYRLDGHTDLVNSVAFSPNSQWIASANYDNTVHVWSSETGQPVGPPLTGHTDRVTSITFSVDGSQIISGSHDGTIRIWAALPKWPKLPQQITSLHLSRRPASHADRIQLEGHPSVLSTSRSPDGSLYSASTLEGNVSIWNADRELLWETKTFYYPIHLLRFSETQLILSTLDGSTSSWNLMNGKPTHREPIIRGPQLDTNSIHQLKNSATGGVSWFPYGLNAGLWAYVDGCLIRFEGEEKSVTIFDVGKLSELD